MSANTAQSRPSVKQLAAQFAAGAALSAEARNKAAALAIHAANNRQASRSAGDFAIAKKLAESEKPLPIKPVAQKAPLRTTATAVYAPAFSGAGSGEVLPAMSSHLPRRLQACKFDFDPLPSSPVSEVSDRLVAMALDDEASWQEACRVHLLEQAALREELLEQEELRKKLKMEDEDAMIAAKLADEWGTHPIPRK